ncbi:MAG: glycosyltransferase family 9 protein [Bacteroidetes bacterium]|nr:glycosyltransferase family 9 protein [Bacteroidota bacterium]
MVQKILLTRFSSIGDIIITTPIIRAFSKAYPNAQIHFATKRNYAELVQHNPHIHHLHLLYNDFDDLVSQLTQHEFDLFIDLHKNLRTSLLKRKLKFKKYFTYKKGNFKKSLLVQLHINTLNAKHNLTRYFEAFSDLGIKDDGMGYDFYFPKAFSFKGEKASTLPDKYLVFALGGKQFTKKLPVEQIISVVKSFNMPVVLIGGNDEKEEAMKISSACQNTLNLVGVLSLIESAHVIKMANKVVSHDTGMMHLACALDKSIASIWGNTVIDFGFAPLHKKHSSTNNLIIENNQIGCRPCSRHGKKKCPKGHFKCMLELDFNPLITWANQL